MKKILYIIIGAMCLGCSSKKLAKNSDIRDSMVVVFGYKELSIEDSVVILYDSFKLYKDSFSPIYNVNTKSVIFMRSKCTCKYGDFKVNAKGDTLFCVEDNYEKYVSAKEWHKYYEQFKEH